MFWEDGASPGEIARPSKGECLRTLENASSLWPQSVVGLNALLQRNESVLRRFWRFSPKQQLGTDICGHSQRASPSGANGQLLAMEAAAAAWQR